MTNRHENTPLATTPFTAYVCCWLGSDRLAA
jgi:hypothetical protein